VHVRDSRIETTVNGLDAAENAGDIDIPLRGNEGPAPVVPKFVVIDDSVIRANAVAANAGNITIAGENVLISPDSLIQAKSEFGLSGTIAISSPDAVIVSQLTPLPGAFVDPSDRLLPPCAARTQRTGSFVVQARESIPAAPDAPLSPALLAPETGTAAPAFEPDACPVFEEKP
jgi:large exoprotein involved in heme utilization and adhesion